MVDWESLPRNLRSSTEPFFCESWLMTEILLRPTSCIICFCSSISIISNKFKARHTLTSTVVVFLVHLLRLDSRPWIQRVWFRLSLLNNEMLMSWSLNSWLNLVCSKLLTIRISLLHIWYELLVWPASTSIWANTETFYSVYVYLERVICHCCDLFVRLKSSVLLVWSHVRGMHTHVLLHLVGPLHLYFTL